MAFFGFKTLVYWMHNVFFLGIFWMLEMHQRMITHIDYDYYKSIALFVFFGFYAVVSIISLVLKTKKDRDIRDYHSERKKAQVALRKYIEERTKKINNQNE